MDIFSIKRFSAIDIPQVLDELNEPKIDNKFVKLLQDKRVKLWLRLQDFPINFDGEPAKLKEIDFEVVPGVLKLALPKKTPLLKG
jgi:diacylglycerol kinase family enzyme